MLKFALIAIHFASGTPESYVLDHAMSIDDCGTRIEEMQTTGIVWLDDKTAVNSRYVTLACELQK